VEGRALALAPYFFIFLCLMALNGLIYHFIQGNMQSNPDGFAYSSSQVMSYSNDGRNPPKYFEASSSTKRGPDGVRETQKSLRDSESGLHSMAVGHHIGQ
jgi:hypothetical protein